MLPSVWAAAGAASFLVRGQHWQPAMTTAESTANPKASKGCFIGLLRFRTPERGVFGQGETSDQGRAVWPAATRCAIELKVATKRDCGKNGRHDSTPQLDRQRL